MALMGQVAGKAPEQQLALELSTAVMALRLMPKDLALVLRTQEDCLLLLVRLPVVEAVSVQRWGLVGGRRLGRVGVASVEEVMAQVIQVGPGYCPGVAGGEGGAEEGTEGCPAVVVEEEGEEGVGEGVVGLRAHHSDSAFAQMAAALLTLVKVYLQ